MAEIKVEPKRGGLGWLWVIILLALIAAGIWYFMRSSVPATTTPADSTRTSSGFPPAALVEGVSNG